jgi:hypothetical protein
MELFIQGVGIPEIREVVVETTGSGHDLVSVAIEAGFPKEAHEVALIFIEEEENPVERGRGLSDIGIKDGSVIHVHTCRTIEVTCHYVAATKVHHFTPNKKVKRVKDFFLREFGLDPRDFGSFTLLICNSHTEPDENTHIGALTKYPECSLCFDLVKRENVQGYL